MMTAPCTHKYAPKGLAPWYSQGLSDSWVDRWPFLEVGAMVAFLQTSVTSLNLHQHVVDILRGMLELQPNF